MTRLFVAAAAIWLAWTLLDSLGHRLWLAPLYESDPRMWRPASEMSATLIGAITALLIAVFVSAYKILVRPKSPVAGICFGGLLGVALGASSGFGAYIHSPIPLALAWGWFALGAVKGLVAGGILGAMVRGDRQR